MAQVGRQVVPMEDLSILETEANCTGTKHEVIQVAPTPTTPLKSLVEWMTSGAEIHPTDANLKDVRQAQEFLQKWEEEHASSSSPSGLVNVALPTDGGEPNDNSSTESPDVNAAQRKKSLARLDRHQITDEEFVRMSPSTRST